MSAVVPWPDDRIDQLIALWRQGLPSSRIASWFCDDGYKVTRNAIIGKIHRLRQSGELNIRRVPPLPQHRERPKAAPPSKLEKPSQPPPDVTPKKSVAIEKPSDGRMRAARIPSGLPSAAPPPETVNGVEYPIGKVPLLGLRFKHCRFPMAVHPPLFCGADRIENSSYCADHHKLCHSGRWSSSVTLTKQETRR